jgi:hypothetical protein
MSSAELFSDEQLARFPPSRDAKDGMPVLLQITLEDADKRAAMENFGMPVVCESDENEATLDHGAPIYGIISLRELCRQRQFNLLVVSNFRGEVEDANRQFRQYFPRGIRPAYSYSNWYV